MTNKVYNEAKRLMLTGGVNFASDAFKLALVLTNTTAGTEVDANTMGGFTTLDQATVVGYTAGGVALTTKSVAEGTNRAYFDADDVTYTALPADVRQYAGMVLYKDTGTFSTGVPIGWFDTPGFPFWGNGSNVVVTWSANGILEIT